MKNTIIVIVVVALFILGAYLVYDANVTNIASEIRETQADLSVTTSETQSPDSTTSEQLANGPSVQPIEHASMVLTWGGRTVYVDPVGGAERYTDMLAPDLVLVTDIHGDHLSVETLEGIVAGDSRLVVPQAVYDRLPEALAAQAVVLANGDTREERDFAIAAVPMYNLPESADSYHVKGRGNGYVVEQNGFRVYIAGDTSATLEMRRLNDIDMAFVPMNLPYTMTVDEAVDGVIAFAPAVVIPYHYRSQDGLSDVERFKAEVEARNPAMKVLLLNWYPEAPAEAAADETVE